MTRHRPFGELSAGLRRRVADRDVERERIWHAINQAADEIRYTLFGSNLRDWLDRVARPLIFGDETSAGDSSGGPEFCSTCGTVVESSAGGASTREGEADPMMSAPSPPAEGAPGTRPPGAPPTVTPSPLTHYQWDPDIGWLAVCRKCGNGPLVGVEEQRGLCGECKVIADLRVQREGAAEPADPPWLTKEESDEVLSDLDTAQQALHVIERLATGNIDPWTWPGVQ